MSSPEARAESQPDRPGDTTPGSHPAWEFPTSQLPVIRPHAEKATAYEQRLRLLEMSSLFWELGGGPLRALARQMRDLPVHADQVQRLKAEGHDSVIFVAAGTCDRIITDKSGRELLNKRAGPGDQIVLPPPEDRDKYTMSVRGVTDTMFATLDRQAMTDVLASDYGPVAAALDKAWVQEVAAFDYEPTAGKDAAQIVAICAAKGGAGSTTIAVNAGAALAINRPGQVLLVDLATPYGHAALIADLVVTGSIVSASYAKPGDFGMTLRNHIVRHPTGLSVLPGALRPEEADLLTGELVGRAMTEVSTFYRVILVDIGTSLSEAALAVIERSRRVLLVVAPEIAALTDVRRAMAVFTDLLQVPDARIDMVLNQRVPRSPLGRDGVEAILRRPMAQSIGYDGSRPEEATLAGGLLLQRDPDSVMARGARQLAALIAVKLGLEG